MSIPSQWEHTQPDPGRIVWGLDGDREVAVHDYATTPFRVHGSDRISFGPLTIAPSTGGRVGIKTLDFPRQPTTSLSRWWESLAIELPLLSAGGLLAARADNKPDSPHLTRRQFVAATVTAIGGIAAGRYAAHSADDASTITIAEIDFATNTRGYEIGLHKDLASVLPVDRTYLVLREGKKIGQLTPTSPTFTMPPGRTGMVSVLTPSQKSFIHLVRRILSGDNPIEYTVDLMQPASEYDPETEVSLTSDPTIVNLVRCTRERQCATTVVAIEEMPIPHIRDPSWDDVGEWTIREDEIVYIAGTEAPNVPIVSITVDIPATR